MVGHGQTPAPAVGVRVPDAEVLRAKDKRPGIAAGRVEEYAVPSRTLGRERRVFIYTPPGYQPRESGYDLLLAFDGGEYLSLIPLPLILDTLQAAHLTPAFVAVLVDDSTDGARLADLANHARFAAFVGDELLPWVRQRWAVTHDPKHTILTGSSAGGLASAYLALQRPDLFGNVLAQSPALWRGSEGSSGPPYEWLTGRYSALPRQDIRFFIDVGSMETQPTAGGGPVFIDTSRRFRDVLQAKGYTVTYTEVPDAVHRPEDWRLRLPIGLVKLTEGWIKD